MLDHLGIQCADMDASKAFYDAVLAPLGVSRQMDFGVAVGYGTPQKPDFWIGVFDSGEGFRESHIAFAATDRAAVRAFFDAAVAAGAEVLHEPQFSRTDLFEAVTSLPATADVTLEDTLRSFGTLLRDGRIAKIRRGQFRLTGIADEDRAAG